jgi:hypothetical protein
MPDTHEIDVIEWGWDGETVNNYWVRFTIDGVSYKIDWGPGSRSIGKALTVEFLDELQRLIPVKWIE